MSVLKIESGKNIFKNFFTESVKYTLHVRRCRGGVDMAYPMPTVSNISTSLYWSPMKCYILRGYARKIHQISERASFAAPGNDEVWSNVSEVTTLISDEISPEVLQTVRCSAGVMFANAIFKKDLWQLRVVHDLGWICVVHPHLQMVCRNWGVVALFDQASSIFSWYYNQIRVLFRSFNLRRMRRQARSSSISPGR